MRTCHFARMAYRLKDRLQRFPNTIQFVDPATGFKSIVGSSFSKVVSGVLMTRIANPAKTRQHNLSVDARAVEEEVDAFIAQRCSEIGWNDFIVEASGGASAAAPFHNRTPAGAAARIGRVARAAALSVEWIASGAEAVPVELAVKRADVCAICPLNDTDGDWLSSFTTTAAAAIKKALEMRAGLKLSTPLDEKLGVCNACDCVLRLKIHMPVERILAKMPGDVFSQLDKACWIRSEKP